jgi:hypothetical protein
MAAIIREEPDPLPAAIPVPLRWTIGRCLAKQPSEREIGHLAAGRFRPPHNVAGFAMGA